MSQAIISLKPQYAKLVVSGKKTVELRNRIVRLTPGTVVWIYATRPMARMVGIAEIESVVHARPAEIWRRFEDDMCVDRNGFESYTGNRERVSALVLKSVKKLGDFITLDRIRHSVQAFQPPQFYARLPPGSRLRGTLDRIRVLGEPKGMGAVEEWRSHNSDVGHGAVWQRRGVRVTSKRAGRTGCVGLWASCDLSTVVDTSRRGEGIVSRAEDSARRAELIYPSEYQNRVIESGGMGHPCSMLVTTVSVPFVAIENRTR